MKEPIDQLTRLLKAFKDDDDVDALVEIIRIGYTTLKILRLGYDISLEAGNKDLDELIATVEKAYHDCEAALTEAKSDGESESESGVEDARPGA